MNFIDMKSKKNQWPAFTLIELLIVVLIIAILAAIAVPNFLEFQVRAKVSRVANDLRVLSLCWEAYLVEYDTYPHDQDNSVTSGQGEQSMRLCSTPIAFISSSRFQDPFSKFQGGAGADIPNENDVAPWYQAATGVDPDRRTATQSLEPIQSYLLFSLGPDQTAQMINDDWPFLDENVVTYDPTNGTVSLGEVCRFGGNYRSGDWRINGIDWETWGNIQLTYP